MIACTARASVSTLIASGTVFTSARARSLRANHSAIACSACATSTSWLMGARVKGEGPLAVPRPSWYCEGF